MSYLSRPKLFFSGKFRADPSTVNNTPDNFNPNANFPPNGGDNVGNNVQLYWNPNGTGQFALDCTVTQVLKDDGSPVPNDPLVGQCLVSENAGSALNSGKLVDLDPMQQNVTELWGLSLQIGKDPLGTFLATAYSNAWVQVVNGRGDYAGSAFYQSVLQPTQEQIDSSPVLQRLLPPGQKCLSIGFTVRSYNSSDINYQIDGGSLAYMNVDGVPTSVTDKLAVIGGYNMGPHGTGTPGLIPTTSYFQVLLGELLTADEVTRYQDTIMRVAAQPYQPRTPFDFTYGQVFGTIGMVEDNEPTFMTADRMLTPTSVSADSAPYPAYFAPFSVSGNTATVNLGNALPSTQPASPTHSYVNTEALGTLSLCYFKGDISVANAVPLGDIAYQDNSFYVTDAGLARISFDACHEHAVGRSPLGILSTVQGQTPTILLRENPEGIYLRANQYVFRMNPGMPTTAEQPRGGDQKVAVYVSKYGKPLAGTEIVMSLMPSLEAAQYTNGTLGTGGSSGLVNMGLPTTAVHFNAKATTDANGIARFHIVASNPGNPRGYLDGQIYFLNYGLSNPDGYVQSPDDLVSLQIYTQQPDIQDITWENFAGGVLSQYGKIYPIMGFMQLGNKAFVTQPQNATQIQQALNRTFGDPSLMPVTRDMSASRLKLLNDWFYQYTGSNGS